jgi:hypothetical protein
MGHLTYMSIYVFPWFFYTVLRAKPVMAAVFLVLSLYHNLYYFVILGLMSGWMMVYQVWTKKDQTLTKIWQYRSKIMIFGASCAVFLSPWIAMLLQAKKFEGLPQTVGWGGAIDFSADLFGILIPSAYSRYLWTMTDAIGRKLPFAWGIFEQHIYPGIIILVGVALIFWEWHKLRAKEHDELKPWVMGMIGFWVLTLGPFLHVLGKWKVNLEGIPFVIPLPFTIFHYLPFMDNIRSPGRLAIGMIFFAYVTIGLWLSKRQGRYWIVIVLLSLVFLLDHPFKYAPAVAREIPTAIYQTIGSDLQFFSVYEMPSGVRDGFKYFGNLESLDFINGQLIHRKPVLAGYFGRVNDFKREYFASNPFFGYMGRLMDAGVEHNGAIDRTELPKWQEMDIEGSQHALDLLATKYVILKNEEFYSASA